MDGCISLLKGNPGLSRQDFIEQFEARCVLLVQGMVPQIRGYRRNFVCSSDAPPFSAASDFDVLIELWFDGHAGYEAYLTRSMEREIASQIAENENTMLDRSAMRMFGVDEHGGQLQEDWKARWSRRCVR
jgi:hypothetical protein